MRKIFVIAAMCLVGILAGTLWAADLEYSLTFEEPSIGLTDLYGESFAVVKMPGALGVGKLEGTPVVQIAPVKLLVPYGSEVTGVNVIVETVEIDAYSKGVDLVATPVAPYQPPIPIGHSVPASLAMDWAAYSSNEEYPQQTHENVGVGYAHGYAILTVNLFPVQYVPADGKLSYHSKMTIEVDLEETSQVNRFYRGKEADREWARSLVLNPELVESYGPPPPDRLYDGGLCDPGDNGGLGYDYVIITREAMLDFTATYNWDDLIAKKESEGLQATKVSVEAILACVDYEDPDPLFNDTPARIREFCRDAYQDWGTQYILVGGDQDGPNSVLRRELYYSYEGDCESDLYWSNLDNSFNADEDSRWGESGDEGFDLYSDLWIGSIPCDVGTDVSNWLTKAFFYTDNHDPDYLDNASFYGGNTGWSCQGDDFIDYSAIQGASGWLGPDPNNGDPPYPGHVGFQYGFETWNAENWGNEYDLTVKWTAEPPNPGGWMGGTESAAISGMRQSISDDEVTLISGIAHANASMSLDVYASSWESQYHNTKPFFIHDYGCHCGDMDAADDGVLHSMLFHSDVELAFGCVYNTGYGWGNFDNTGSSSSLQQKSFWDYLFDTANNSGGTVNWQMGKAQAWSKDLMAPLIDWDPSYQTWRGIIESCLLFGDPAQLIKPPVTPDHNVGIMSLDVPPYVTPDVMIEVSSTVINNGENDEADVVVRFVVDEVPVDSTIIPLFQAHSAQAVSFDWTPAFGYYLVKMQISIPGVVEDFYDDNEKSQIVVAGPDIAVTSVQVGDFAAVGIPKNVAGTIENFGTLTEAVTVYLRADGVDVDSQFIDLDSGESTQLNFSWLPAYPGTYPVGIYAKPEGTEPYTGNNELTEDVQVFVAKGYVLIVDDDQGRDYEDYFEDALTTSEYLWDRWDRSSSGSPSTSTLQDYTGVVWFTGDDYTTTLTDADLANLAGYLDIGGKLFLTGENIGYDIHEHSFYTDYLHAHYQGFDANVYTLLGVQGDYIGDGLELSIVTGDGANNQDWPGAMLPISPGTGVFRYEGTPRYGGIKVDNGTFRVVYFSFGFEGINDMYDRHEVMSRTMAWLAGPILSYFPGDYDFGDKCSGLVDSTALDVWNAGSGMLDYTIDESADWVSVHPASGSSGGEHDTITVVLNTTGLSQGPHSCDITINTSTGSGVFTVSVNITESLLSRGDANGDMELGMADALMTLRWMYVPGSEEPSCMDAADTDDDGEVGMGDATMTLQYLYVPDSPEPPAPFPGCGADPTQDGLDCGTHPCNGGLAKSSIADETGLLSLGEPEIDAGGVSVPVYLKTDRALSGFAYTIDYNPADLVLRSVEVEGLVSEQFDFVSAKPNHEKGEVTVGSVVSLGMKRILPPGRYAVAAISFDVASADLDRTELEIVDAELVDEETNTLGCQTQSVMVDRWSHHRLPRVYALGQAVPNPFLKRTKIAYALPKECQVVLRVYNNNGQMVRALVGETRPAGHYRVEWDGKDASGESVRNGVYFYRMEARSGDTHEFTSTKKLILMR
jgi:hypothetical protein